MVYIVKTITSFLRSKIFSYIFFTQKSCLFVLDPIHSCPRIPYFKGTFVGTWGDDFSGQVKGPSSAG